MNVPMAKRSHPPAMLFEHPPDACGGPAAMCLGQLWGGCTGTWIWAGSGRYGTQRRQGPITKLSIPRVRPKQRTRPTREDKRKRERLLTLPAVQTGGHKRVPPLRHGARAVTTAPLSGRVKRGVLPWVCTHLPPLVRGS